VAHQESRSCWRPSAFRPPTRRLENPKSAASSMPRRDASTFIDLLKTKALLDQASEFAAQSPTWRYVLSLAPEAGARSVREVAEATGMPTSITAGSRLLTNFQTMSERIRRLHDLERYETDGQLALLPTRERLSPRPTWPSCARTSAA